MSLILNEIEILAHFINIIIFDFDLARKCYNRDLLFALISRKLIFQKVFHVKNFFVFSNQDQESILRNVSMILDELNCVSSSNVLHFHEKMNK